MDVEKISLTRQQIQALLDYIKKASQVINNLEKKNFELYFECCKDTLDLTISPFEFGQFLLEIKEKLK